MEHLLTVEQRLHHREFLEFAALNFEPYAEEWDREQRIPDQLISVLGRSGYLGSTLPTEFDGQGWGIVTFGLLNEAFGRHCSALTGLLTVQAMVSMALLKWGTHDQKRTWLPPLARGELIGAFALTESGAGSDLQGLVTKLAPDYRREGLLLNGEKRWISCAQMADVFLVFGKMDERSLACLVPRDAAGLAVEPIQDLMGFRGAGLGRLTFDNVRVPTTHIVGKPGFGLSHVAPIGLQYGRISTACSGMGLLRGCFEESIDYAAARRIGNRTMGEIGVIRSLIARMGADLEAAVLLCYNACRAEEEHLPEAFQKALIAKYFTSQAAVKAASDAVQIHGALGCHGSSPVSRYYRDAKILEIIEGTTQIHEQILGKMFIGQAGSRPRPELPLGKHKA